MVPREKLALFQSLCVAKKAFDDNGYAVIPDVFEPRHLHYIRRDAYGHISRNYSLQQSTNLQIVSNRGKLFPALLINVQDLKLEWCNAFLQSCQMKKIVRYFLGDEPIRQLNNQIYFRESGDGDQFAWHQDITFRTPPEDFENIEESYLQTIICVDELTQTNGTIEFLPGSHRTGNWNLIPRDNSEIGLRKFVRGELSGHKIVAKPGDVVVWSAMTVHGSEQNNSGRSRMTYMNGFARDSAVKNKERFPLYATT